MLKGVIDIGSNTLRLSIFKCHTDGGFTPLVSKKIVAGLAGYKEDKALTAKGERKLSKCLQEFLYITNALEVSEVHAFATASLRNTNNAAEIISRVFDSTGLKIQVFSGEEEARLSFLGAYYSTHMETGLVVDIGGASSELIRVVDGIPRALCSIPVGCLSLSLRTCNDVFFGCEMVEEMRETINRELTAAADMLKEPASSICFVGGTARAAYRVAAEMNPRDNRSIAPSEISHIIACLQLQNSEIIEAIRFAAPERIFTLFAGTLIMQSIIKQSEATTLLVSRCGIREGYLIDNISKR